MRTVAQMPRNVAASPETGSVGPCRGQPWRPSQTRVALNAIRSGQHPPQSSFHYTCEEGTGRHPLLDASCAFMPVLERALDEKKTQAQGGGGGLCGSKAQQEQVSGPTLSPH